MCRKKKEKKHTHTVASQRKKERKMGSNYFGEQNYFGNNERGAGGLSSSSSSSSSRKGKKNSSDKPKQPQRGLGVAQLEKIRLHSQLGCTYLPSLHHNPYASNFNQVNYLIIYIQIIHFCDVSWRLTVVCSLYFMEVQEDMRLQTAHSSSLPSSSFSYSSSSSPPYGFQGHHGVMVYMTSLIFDFLINNLDRRCDSIMNFSSRLWIVVVRILIAIIEMDLRLFAMISFLS